MDDLNRNPDARAPPYARGVMVGRAKTPAPLFGQRLAALRRRRGLTQPQLAKELRISVGMMEYYERRAPNPSLEFIKAVAKFFDVSPSYLVADEPHVKKKPGPKSRIDERVEKIKQLPPKQQELVLIMLDSFLAQAKRAS
jgi:transcriptional regulator with XRE-family HTH domain